MILLLAGLQGIPRELEEAAAIDGASRWQAIRYVMLPLLGPTIRVSVFLSIIGVAPAVRPRVGHDPRRAGERLEHDGRRTCSTGASCASSSATAARSP